MKKIFPVIYSLVLALLFSGCASYFSVSPSITPPEVKIGEIANISIPEKDLKMKKSTSFGLVGLLFPLGIEVGDVLEKYTTEYFGNMFSEIAINQDTKSNYVIEISIVSFKISSVQKAASLELQLSATNQKTKTVLKKNYSGAGKGHVPFYMGTPSQVDHLYDTTEQAFKSVFDQIHDDLCNTFLYN